MEKLPLRPNDYDGNINYAGSIDCVVWERCTDYSEYFGKMALAQQEVAIMKVEPWNRVVEGDCCEILDHLPAGSVDLAFADPPFNIGYDYDKYFPFYGSTRQ